MKVASCTYTGDALEPAVTLEDGDAVIPEGEYTVEYSNNTNAGTAGWPSRMLKAATTSSRR